MSVRRSASGDIANPFAESDALMKASMESCSGLNPKGSAKAEATLSGCTDQCPPRLSVAAALSASLSGHTAPLSIHAFTVATCAGVRASPSGGIRSSSSVLVMRRNIGDASAFPATIAGPSCPPLKANAFASSRNSPFCFFAPWHSMQCFCNSGRISFSKLAATAAERQKNGVMGRMACS